MRQLGTSISANAIGFAYGLAPVFSDVSFRLEQGHFLGVVGPNGAGKTTLLKCLAGLLKPSAGEILLGGDCLPRLQREEIAKIVAVVPQDTQVGFGFSVEEFVMMGRIPHLKRFSRETDRDQEAVRWAIESTSMTPFAERLVTSLSGGERQRAAIARALAQEPKVLLLDEPTSHLDIRRQVEILDLVKIMSRERDITVVGVFHDLSLASMYCDEILMMTDGGTRYSGTPEEVFTQENVGSVYGDRVVVTDHPVHSTPLVAPRSRVELNNNNMLGHESGIRDRLRKVGELGKSDQSSKSGRLTLITGGARSGKSSFAESMAAESGTRVMYVATCEPMDAEMRARVSKHRERRPKSWITVEEPIEIASTITNEAKNYDAVLVDCLGLFVSNHLLAQDEDAGDESKIEAVLTEVARFAKAARDAECHVIVVTNEVGMGVVPAYPLGRLFRDLLGWANQIVAEEADEVYLCVVGEPVRMKPQGASGVGAQLRAVNRCQTPKPRLERIRDLLIYNTSDGAALIVSCDSAGAIGPKGRDVIAASGYVLGRYITRVALMELIACGAEPILVVDALCVERDPTGNEIIKGVRDEAALAGLDPEMAVTGSTEENISTCQTGIGITAIGVAERSELRLGKASIGDVLVCIGVPKVGNEVTLDDPEIVDLRAVRALANIEWVHEIVPVGSRGIRAEAWDLAETSGLGTRVEPSVHLDLDKSAGPATCVVAACDGARWQELSAITGKPVFLVGEVEAP